MASKIAFGVGGGGGSRCLFVNEPRHVQLHHKQTCGATFFAKRKRAGDAILDESILCQRSRALASTQTPERSASIRLRAARRTLAPASLGKMTQLCIKGNPKLTFIRSVIGSLMKVDASRRCDAIDGRKKRAGQLGSRTQSRR